jgi:multiple sugar transport system substrate-binding protein
MEEIVFSVFAPGDEVVSNLEALLRQFEQERQIRVRLEVITWSDGWNRLLEIALHGSGPDLSEIGSTWVEDLARMNALRPFSQAELSRIVAGKDYFQSAWAGAKEGETDNNPITWAIPFVSDARVVYYRRSLLKQAGVDENRAFTNVSNFEYSLSRLKAVGIDPALALSTRGTSLNLQNLASWIWSSGGDFFSSNGTRLAFDRPEALNGFKAYFRLGRYLGGYRLDQVESEKLFPAGKAAVLMSGYWVLARDLPEDVRQDLGIAPVLGSSYVGAEHLVVWHHSLHQDAALKLVQFLSRAESGKSLFPLWGVPPYREGWKQAPFDRPEYGVQMHAMRTGRSFPDSRLWALIEKRLSDLIPEIWQAVLTDPERSDEIVEREITTLAKRLRLTLES